MDRTDKDLGVEIPELGRDGASPHASESWVFGDTLPIDIHTNGPGQADPAPPAAAARPPAGSTAEVAIVVPPERVRFHAPAVVRPEGSGGATEGRVLNLSTQGIACSTAVQLTVGERVWIRFRLALAQEPVDLLCEVIWSSHPPRSEPLYGLRFAGLTREESAGVERAVRERTEGRAGEWPLPLPPELLDDAEVDKSSPGSPKGTSHWVSGAAGVAAGIGLALVLSALAPNDADIEMPSTFRPSAEPAIPPPAEPPTLAAEADAESAGLEPAIADVDIAPASTPSKPPLPPSPPAAQPSLAEPPTPAVAKSTAAVAPRKLGPARTEPSTKRASPPRVGAGAGVVHASRGTDAVTLELQTDGPVREHVAFWLSKPRRLVVDVPGRRSTLGRQALEVSHPLVKRIRVGQHRKKVRFVVETIDSVEPDAVVKHHDKAVRVTIRRKR